MADTQWASEIPYLVESFEKLDYYRLQTNTKCLFSYQSGSGDYFFFFFTVTNDSAKIYGHIFFFEFELKNEIDCFATDINKTNFILSSML